VPGKGFVEEAECPAILPFSDSLVRGEPQIRHGAENVLCNPFVISHQSTKTVWSPTMVLISVQFEKRDGSCEIDRWVFLVAKAKAITPFSSEKFLIGRRLMIIEPGDLLDKQRDSPMAGDSNQIHCNSFPLLQTKSITVFPMAESVIGSEFERMGDLNQIHSSRKTRGGGPQLYLIPECLLGNSKTPWRWYAIVYFHRVKDNSQKGSHRDGHNARQPKLFSHHQTIVTADSRISAL
jgi:hypothetical protein